ncbi:helix-turn-helix transcriptional regulator [Halorubrum sp. N11]|uniref:helix-turn-helix transcriptional regulator n=1 Tax=Halorubrum sp. N11 TaxID=3402276 RepID=UPI003EBD091F
MQRTVVLLVVLAAFIAGAGLASTGAAQSGAGVPAGGFEQMDVAPDDVLIEATVEPDGDAVWVTQYRVRLANDDEEQAFEDLRADVESDPNAYTGRFAERMRATAGAAENATGREMNVTNVTVTAERRELPQSYGVLTYRFEWRNFAATDGDRLVVGDAVDALFLDEATSLIVSWEDGYRLGDVSPSPTETRDSAVVWEGPKDFTEGEPRVTIEPEGRGVGPLLFVALGLLVAIVAVIGYRRRPWERSASDRRSDAPGATVGGPTDDTSDTPSDTSAADAADTDEGGESDDDSEETESDADEGVGSAPPVDDDLLSNEEQVLRLVEANGGRMKQKRVAEELDWTAAKTSQVVTGLRDEGDLDGFRLGRENVISLPDYDASSENSGEDGGENGDEDGGKNESENDAE